MNPKRILLILAGLLAFTVGLVTALHAQDSSQRFDDARHVKPANPATHPDKVRWVKTDTAA